jgi:hypothetical protein
MLGAMLEAVILGAIQRAIFDDPGNLWGERGR